MLEGRRRKETLFQGVPSDLVHVTLVASAVKNKPKPEESPGMGAWHRNESSRGRLSGPGTHGLHTSEGTPEPVPRSRLQPRRGGQHGARGLSSNPCR